MIAVAARGVSKNYRIYKRPAHRFYEWLTLGRGNFHRDFAALRDISVEIPRGASLGVIGENGSGKTTLLEILAGVMQPTAGSVNVVGRTAALLELGAGFNPEFTGLENIHLYGSILGLSDGEIRSIVPAIEAFAEIGSFIDQPVKTYSSGMFVRLAFSVAIHVQPEVLIVDEALSVGDIYFQQRSIRRIQQLKAHGVTIVFVSHDMATVKAVADQTLWLHQGRMEEYGPTDKAVMRYLAHIVSKQGGERYERPVPREPVIETGLEQIPELPPDPVEGLPNVDSRHGSGRAFIQGVRLMDPQGTPIGGVDQGETILFRVSVRFKDRIEHPNVGFMLRDRLGQDVTGTNALLEGLVLPPGEPGEVYSVDFYLQLPFLHHGAYYFSPAIADGNLDQYEMCDWVDNACALEVHKRVDMYGAVRLPCRVRHVRAPVVAPRL